MEELRQMRWLDRLALGWALFWAGIVLQVMSRDLLLILLSGQITGTGSWFLLSAWMAPHKTNKPPARSEWTSWS